MELQVKAIKTMELRKLRQMQINKEATWIMYKIESFFYKSQRKKESNERELMLSSEKLQKKKMDVELKNKRNEYLKEIERQKAIENIKQELAKQENAGKGIADIFGAITKDKEGIFANEATTTPNMGGMGADTGRTTDVNRDRAVMGLPPI